MSRITIRPAVATDCSTLLQFVKDLAVYENALTEVAATRTDLRLALFGPLPRAFALICDVDGIAVGFAIYFFNFSTWLGKCGLFLEDLYVAPDYRGQGAGKGLLKHLANVAVEENCGRFEWNVLKWNQPAIDFYESFGARAQDEWVGYRLAGEPLERFANPDE